MPGYLRRKGEMTGSIKGDLFTALCHVFTLKFCRVGPPGLATLSDVTDLTRGVWDQGTKLIHYRKSNFSKTLNTGFYNVVVA